LRELAWRLSDSLEFSIITEQHASSRRGHRQGRVLLES
jgi:hypothetical protein